MTADLIVLSHFTFILFVMFGGLLIKKWRGFIYLHLPAVAWGAAVEFFGWVCPLTTWENLFRRQSSEEYSIGFVEHYIFPLIYPELLTRDIQIVFGIGVILLNLFIYRWVYIHWDRQAK